jgi:hypothetical protein
METDTLDVHVKLTNKEVEALRAMLGDRLVHVALDHGWTVRDAAMEALGKVLDAAKKAA